MSNTRDARTRVSSACCCDALPSTTGLPVGIYIFIGIFSFLAVVGYAYILRGNGYPAMDISSLSTSSPALQGVTAPSSVHSSEPFASSSPIISPPVALPSFVQLDVPFTPQAPFGEWSDPGQEDGCEEASVAMALHWASGTSLTRTEALQEITAVSDYELKTYGFFADTSAADTIKIIIEGYFHFMHATLRYDITGSDIRAALADGNVVIVPADGRVLANPHYTPPGPLHHMLVVIGYDDAAQEFITNDPGTRDGAQYRYSYATFDAALEDYVSGDHEPLIVHRTAMIVIPRETAH